MTSTLLGQIAGTPWMIHEPALQTIVELAAREPPDPANLEAWKSLTSSLTTQALALRRGQEMQGARRASLRDGVAVLPVSGPIFRYANLMTNFSGATALSELATDLQLAMDEPRVRAILLEIDSPGGEVRGISEMASAIRTAAAAKPVVAYIEGVGASAAYWLASAATRVVVAPTAVLGSLGAMLMVPPRRPGEKPIEIVSSQTPSKRPDPETDTGRAQLQAVVDRQAEEFLSAAAAFRGLTPEDLIQATHGGGLIVGRDAVAGRLADQVGTFEETLARLAAGDAGGAAGAPARPASPARHQTPTGGTMAEVNTQGTAAPADANLTAAPAPAPAPAAQSEAAAPTPTPPAPDAMAAERTRVTAILEAAKPGFQAMANLAIKLGWSPETFAQAQASAEPALQAARLGGFKDSLPAPVATAPAQPEAAAPQTEEQKLQAEWDGDAKLRAEFGRFESFAAYRKAEAEGRVRRVARG